MRPIPQKRAASLLAKGAVLYVMVAKQPATKVRFSRLDLPAQGLRGYLETYKYFNCNKETGYTVYITTN